ncbi:MAG: hypothetical protein ABWY64_08790, partial [Tardiphaga sp.]
ILETAWLAQPHPDLADAYAHVKLGDSARQRLVRVETLAAKAPGHIESALAVARAAIDAAEFTRAREALAPFTANATLRVAMLMAEIERTENGDSGRARAWTLRAVRALHDPVWTADGYVSDRWRPVSPVTGRIDAFQWQTPLAALPSDKVSTIEAEILRETVLAPPPRTIPRPVIASDAPVPVAPAEDVAPEPEIEQSEPVTEMPLEPVESPAPQPVVPAAPPPLFRDRPELAKDATVKPAANVPPVIPILRAPDDPGVEEEEFRDEFAELNAGQQAGGWRGFLGRWRA